MDSKTCTKCGETKPLDEFGRNRSGRLGRASRCRLCTSEQRRSEYASGDAERSAAKRKKCRYCGERKQPASFPEAPTRDGLGSMCFDCKESRASRSDKACSKCGETKPLDEYPRAKKYTDGRDSRCKSCRGEWQAAHYQANKGRIAEYHAEYRKTDARRSAQEKYRKANRDQINAQARDYYQANRERIREYMAARYEANKEAIATRGAAYNAANPHIRWRSKYRARCKAMGLAPLVEDFTRQDVIDRWGDACCYCGVGPFENLDHAIPVAKGGPHTLENARPACFPCNRAKSDMTEAEWMAEQSELDALTEVELDAAIDAEIERWTK